VQSLPARRVFLDAGAGNGQMTAWFVDRLERTIAIEPGPSLRADLQQNCRSALVLPDTILDAEPNILGALIHCSHVLYYIERSQLLAQVARMAPWLSPEGALVVVLQNHETDCMRTLEALLGRRFDLSALVREFTDELGQRYGAELQLVPAYVTARDLASTYVIAEFMVNLLPMANPPPRADLEDYLQKHLAVPEGGYRFSCHQDFLVIRYRR
jgi:hypothetical protein